MTDKERKEEGAEESIEDLDAPAQHQDEVAGGAGCGTPSMICVGDTCNDTTAQCTKLSHKIVVRAHN
jgi:hypothetical protein